MVSVDGGVDPAALSLATSCRNHGRPCRASGSGLTLPLGGSFTADLHMVMGVAVAGGAMPAHSPCAVPVCPDLPASERLV